MKDDPIVSEVRRIRDTLWQEAGCDLNRLAELAQQEAARIPNPGPCLGNAEALRRYIEGLEKSAPALNEPLPPYRADSGSKQ